MTDYDKNDPAGTDTFVVSDDMIRANWAAAEERLAQEHYFPDNPFTSNRSGKHKFGVGTTAARDAAITAPASGMVWYNTSLGCWQIHNGTSWLSAGNAGVGTTAARDALTSVPTNFTWLSSDEGFTSYYDGTAWVTLAPKGLFHGRISYTSATTVTIARGNAGVLRIEMDGVLHESASDLTIDLSNATDRQDAAEANSTWYYLYLRDNAGTLAGKISSRAPVMDPASGKVGYHDGGGTGGSTAWRCIGAVFNNSAGDIQPFYALADNWWVFRHPPTASPFTQSAADPSALTSYTSLAFTNGFPQTARTGRFQLVLDADTGAQYLHVAHEDASGTIATNRGMVRAGAGAGGGAGRGTQTTVTFDLAIDASPALKYGVSGAFSDFTELQFCVIGWRNDFGLRS